MAVSKNTARFFKWTPVALIAVVIVGLSMSGEESEQPSDETQGSEGSASLECDTVPESLRAFFQNNATDKQPSAQLSHGRIVHSPKSYQGREIYFVSFAVDGGKQIATWMQTGRDPSSSMQGAVRETYADELSILGTAGDPPVHHLSWPGAERSVRCVREAVATP